MIHKNVKIGQVEDVTVLEFGKGTLSVVGGDDSLWIKQIEGKSPVGSVTHIPPFTMDEFNPNMRLYFGSKRSFEIFFDHVLKVKEYFDAATE